MMLDIAAPCEGFRDQVISVIGFVHSCSNIADRLTKRMRQAALRNVISTGYLKCSRKNGSSAQTTKPERRNHAVLLVQLNNVEDHQIITIWSTTHEQGLSAQLDRSFLLWVCNNPIARIYNQAMIHSIPFCLHKPHNENFRCRSSKPTKWSIKPMFKNPLLVRRATY